MKFEAKGKILSEDHVEWLPVTIEVWESEDKQDALKKLDGLTEYSVFRYEREFGKTTMKKVPIYKFDYNTLKIDKRTLRRKVNEISRSSM